MNPLRYRGYYYDKDTGLYYLQSRYYDSKIGRFINADEAEYIILDENNFYTYCVNNPINMIDITGNYSFSVTKTVNTSYYKKKYKKFNDYYIIALTNYVETKNGGTVTWTKDKEFKVSFSLSTSVSAEIISTNIGIEYERKLKYSQSYSFKVDKNKGKYARIVAKIPAQSYKVYVKTKRQTTYYTRYFFWAKAKKVTYSIIDKHLGYVFDPIMGQLTICLQYKNKR